MVGLKFTKLIPEAQVCTYFFFYEVLLTDRHFVSSEPISARSIGHFAQYTRKC